MNSSERVSSVTALKEGWMQFWITAKNVGPIALAGVALATGAAVGLNEAGVPKWMDEQFGGPLATHVVHPHNPHR